MAMTYSIDNSSSLTNSDIFIMEDWCYTARPNQNADGIVGGVGVHWKLFYSNNTNKTYKIWYKFYLWCNFQSSSEIDVRSAFRDNVSNVRGAYIALCCKIDNLDQICLIKIPVGSINADAQFCVGTIGANLPNCVWWPLRYACWDTSNPSWNIEGYLNHAKQYLGFASFTEESRNLLPNDLLSYPLPLPANKTLFDRLNSEQKETITCEKTIAINFNGLEKHIKDIKIFLECNNILIGRTITIGTQSTTYKTKDSIKYGKY